MAKPQATTFRCVPSGPAVASMPQRAWARAVPGASPRSPMRPGPALTVGSRCRARRWALSGSWLPAPDSRRRLTTPAPRNRHGTRFADRRPDPDSYGKNSKTSNIDTHMLLKFSYRGSVLSTVLRRNWAVACLPGYEWRFGGIAATWPSRAGSGMSARRAVAGVFAARRMAGGGASGLRRKGETP